MDLLERLRAYQKSGSKGIRPETKELCGAAADEIERLRAKVDEMETDNWNASCERNLNS